jgi:23S rRNA (cytidine1920-2'-O)/16S rRNA (cytidine1409-2'-O)-methyltransferase
MRLDLYLVENGVYPSRARARAAIEAGRVRVNGVAATKPARTIVEGDAVETDGEAHAYVSRGGVKLESALRTMEIAPAGKVCLDLGASTGGFTDVLLRAGAAKVYAAARPRAGGPRRPPRRTHQAAV